MLAALSGEAGFADAGEVVDLVDALAAVGAGVLLAVINVHVAHLAGPARLTNAPGTFHLNIEHF